MRKLLILVTVGVALYYMVYRALFTFNPDQLAFSLLFYAAELHGLFALLLFLFDMWSPRHPTPTEPLDGLSVDVFIPTYNEDVGLLRRTALAARNIQYPHKTYILDDGNRAAVKSMADALGIGYIARTEHHHAKAGNINHALRQTDGDFVAIFDADHVPQPNFLERTLGFFKDPRMAFVQTPQFFYNFSAFEEFSNAETDEHWEQQSMFFHYLQPGKQRWNSAFFCGTCAIIRREALLEVGGIATETITEDIHTSVLLHARGWKSVYLDEHLATGVAPADAISYFKQRQRWALGNLRVMFICNPLFRRGLTLAQRLSYFSSMYCWTIGFQKLVYYVTPPLMLLTSLMPIDRFFSALVWLYFGNLALQLFTYKALTGGRGRIVMDELFNMLNFWFLIQAFFRAMFGFGQRFVVTSKAGSAAKIPLRTIVPQWLIAGLSVSGLVWWGFKLAHGINVDRLSSSIAAFWSFYVLLMAGAAIIRALSRYDVRSDYRFRESLPVWLLDGEGAAPRLACTFDFNTQGLGLITYEPWPMDRDLPIRLMCQTAPVEATIRLLYQRSDASPKGVYTYGARFVDLPAEQRDQLNMQATLQTLPLLMSRIYRHRAGWREWLRGFLPVRGRRYPVWLGLPLSTLDQPGEWRHARVEALKGRHMTLSSADNAAPGEVREVTLLSPCGIIRGQMRVESVSALTPQGLRQWEGYLETLSTENADRFETLKSLR